MGYLHMLARHQHEVNQKVKEGTWHKVKGTSLAGKTLGIVGLGSSGRALARRGTAASMRVLGYDIAEVPEDPNYERRSFEDLLGESDAVSLHLPATAETRHLMDEAALSLMKPGAWLINTSRGSLVEEKALVEALLDGRISGAALDVFEEEPIATDHPFLSMDNVIVGSHNGSNTKEAVERTTELAVANLIAGLGLESAR
jgi:D-3-phosphoglycerate dehydrogenase